MLMLGIAIAAPLIGLVWGWFAKRLASGFIIGLLIGVGNYVLWTVYNAITDRLGLDTVKNLLVNLALFIVLGIIIGLAASLLQRRQTGASDQE